ncbi:hypothetical protein [Streptomyces sp. GESEQ-4]|uniref:hypothetical protein n=1 Tax=Streptomyces sp. GESEQ-4 TaxID=2812655 RepID=UPI001B32C999|nr:hypothetical protein [Streptomyces sp. GESEQ-4]
MDRRVLAPHRQKAMASGRRRRAMATGHPAAGMFAAGQGPDGDVDPDQGACRVVINECRSFRAGCPVGDAGSAICGCAVCGRE